MQIQHFCPGCGKVTTFSHLFRKSGIPIYQCASCGLGMATPEQFDASSYYDASYFNGGKPDGYSDYVNAKDVLHEHFRKDLSFLQSIGPRQGTLIELGCAYGYFLDVARDAYDVHGLEIAEDAVQACHARGLDGVRHGEASRASMEGFPMADAVVMLDVIEHLPDPVEAFAAVASRLHTGGSLLVTTGDFSSAFARATGKHWRLMTPPQHLWYFTPRSLRQLGERFGLELVHIDYPFKKVPIGLMLFQICRLFSWSPKLPAWTHRSGLPINLFDAMRIGFRKKTA